MKLNVGRTLLLGFGFFGVSILWAIHDSYVPIFLGKDFALDASLVGSILTINTIIVFLIQPAIGSLSDRTRTSLGRRMPFILIFAPLAAIGFAVLPVLVQPSLLWVFVIVLVLTIIALAMFRTPVIALMPDITPSQFRSQANGLINLMGGIGAIIAFAGGAVLFKLNPAYPFWAASILLVLGCGIVLWRIREPKDSTTQAVESRPGLLASLGKILSAGDKSALLLLLAIFAWFVGYNAVSKFFTLYGVLALKLEANQASFLLTFLALMFVIFAVPSGYIAGKFGRRRTILVGIAVIGVLAVIVRILPIEALASGIVLPVLLALIGVGWALINVNSLAMVVDVAPQTELATYTGLYYFASTSAAVLGPFLAGLLIDALGKDYTVIFLIAAVMFAVAFVFMLGVRRGERAEQAVAPAPAE
ncbi:MAG: MFS transporter [Chloroflexi bacterium]|nr:MFS transporter [Chloroflexota bacterium]